MKLKVFQDKVGNSAQSMKTSFVSSAFNTLVIL